MVKAKALVFGIIAAILLVNGSPAFAQEDNGNLSDKTQPSVESPGKILGYYEREGGMTVIPLREEKGVAEMMPAGMTLEDILAAFPMTKESESQLVHREPKVSFILEGVRYQPEQIHLFDGQRLGFTVGKDGSLYAFTSYDCLNHFLSEQSTSTLQSSSSEYSIFYDYINYGGLDRLWVLPNVTFHSLTYMDNEISSMRISAYATCGCTLFEHENLQGDYFDVAAGTDWANLDSYGWDNRASSLVVWP